MKFRIKKETVTVNEKLVNIGLLKDGEEVLVTVDDLVVFVIKPDGTGALCSGISNDSILQLDNDGKIVLEK